MHGVFCSLRLCLVAGDDEDAREDLECPDLDAADDPVVKAMPSGSAAKFWEGLLKDKHEQLLREEEQQVRHWQSSQLHHTDTSPPLDPAGMLLHSCPDTSAPLDAAGILICYFQ